MHYRDLPPASTPRTRRAEAISIVISMWFAALCTNAVAFPAAPYFPLATGTTWTYRESGSTFIDRVIGPSPHNTTHQTVRRESSPSGVDGFIDYSSDAHGVRIHRIVTDISEPGLSVTATIFFATPLRQAPADIRLGETVISAGGLFGNFIISGINVPIGGTFSSSVRPIGFETVTTPAGTFYALRIDQTLTLTITFTFDNQSDAVTTSATSSTWYAHGIGIVRDSSSVDNGPALLTEFLGTSLAGGAPDAAPNAFAFTNVTHPIVNTTHTSNAVTITDINLGVTATVSGGSYSVNGGAFTTEPGSVNNGDSIQVRVTASPTPGVTTCAALNVGTGFAQFCAVNAVAVDTVPDPFSFAPRLSVTPNATITSETVTVSGINSPAPISVSGAAYSVNGGPFTTAPATVTNGSTVAVQLTASNNSNTRRCGSISIGSLTREFCATTLNTAALLGILQSILDD